MQRSHGQSCFALVAAMVLALMVSDNAFAQMQTGTATSVRTGVGFADVTTKLDVAEFVLRHREPKMVFVSSTGHPGNLVGMAGTGSETKVSSAHDAFLKGWNHYLKSTPDDLAAAAAKFKEAINLDPNYGRAHAALALTYWQASQRSWQIYLEVSWKLARILSMRHLNIALKSPSALAYWLASSIYVLQRRYTEAIVAARRAIELAPNSAELYRRLAYILIMNGQLGKAREMAVKAQHLDQNSKGKHSLLLGLIAFAEGKMEKAANLIERGRKDFKHAQAFLPPLIAAYMQLGRTDRGRTLANTYDSWFSTSTNSTDLINVMYFWPFKDKAVATRLATGLVLAGIEGKRNVFYHVSDERRLRGPKIAELIRKSGRKWKIHDVRENGAYPIGLYDSFREDGAVVRIYELQTSAMLAAGIPNFRWTGRYRIEGDLLCVDFPKIETYRRFDQFSGGIGCRPVFRNPDADPGSADEYLMIGMLGFYGFRPAD